MAEFLAKAMPGIVTAVFAAYLAARWSLRRFYAEKWWERKERAYEEIIEALYDILQYCEIKKEDYGGGTGYTEERMKELQERYTRAYWQIKKATDIGAFVVSSEAETILKDLKNRPNLKWEENPAWEIYDQEYRSYQEALKKVVHAARKDLKKSG